MRFDVKVNIDRESFATLDYRPFWAGFAVAAIATLITHLNIIPANFYKPLFQHRTEIKRIDFDKEIKPKLEKTPTSYNLKDTGSRATDADLDKLSAYAVADLDTGQIIAQKNADEAKPIASITKIMTSVIALDLANKDELFAVTKKAANEEPTKLGVLPGEKMSVEELLKGMLLTSANDAAQVVQDGIDHKYEKGIFVKAMNEKARFLGLKNSHFDNPQGFDSKENYSSAGDLIVLTHYALNNYPLISQIVKKDYDFLPANANHKQFDLYNWNGLIGVYPGAMGMKIGNTDNAGKTTIVVSERGGRRLAAVLLGASGVMERDMLAAHLLDLGFEKAAGLKAVAVTEEQLQAKYSSWKYFN